MSKLDVRRRSEEGRVLVGLGLVAVVVAYRNELPKTFAFPLPSLQVFTFPLFDYFVISFSLYALCIGFYFSEDEFSPNVRDVFQRVGHAIGIGSPLLVAFSLTAATGLLFFPNELLYLWYVLFDLGILYVAGIIADTLFAKRGRTNHVIRWGVSHFVDTVKSVTSEPLEYVRRFWEKTWKWVVSIRLTPRIKRILWSFSDTGLFIAAAFLTQYVESGKNLLADQLTVGSIVVMIILLVSIGGLKRVRGSRNQWFKYSVRTVGWVFAVLAGAFSDGIRDILGLALEFPGPVAEFVAIIAAFVWMSVYMLKEAEDSGMSANLSRT